MNHEPVLIDEAVAALMASTSGRYVDATFGRGGHASAILRRLNMDGQLLAMDQDPAAQAHAENHFHDNRLCFQHGRFGELRSVVTAMNWTGQVQGLLLDLGVSSPQLDDPERGFSFHREGPLDMRMDPQRGVPVSVWLTRISEKQLGRVLKEFGEERFHRRVARAIIAAQQSGPITTTTQLAAIVAESIPTREPGKHPATRTFQALRIAVNGELDELQRVLEQALDVLAITGRLVVISFHSLEDRIVKRFMRDHSQPGGLPGLPLIDATRPRLRRIARLYPQADEVARNARARSAVLRVAERIA